MRDKDAKLIWEARFWPFKGKSKSLIKRLDKDLSEVGDLSVDKDDENLIGKYGGPASTMLGASLGGVVLGPPGVFLGAGLVKLTRGVYDRFKSREKREFIIKLFDEGMLKGEATLKRGYRDQNLINKGKELNIKNYKFLTCENCGLQPANSDSKQQGKPYYPGMNESNASRIIEGHHVLPIHLKERESTINDILCLCRNCHSLYHIVTKSEL